MEEGSLQFFAVILNHQMLSSRVIRGCDHEFGRQGSPSEPFYRKQKGFADLVPHLCLLRTAAQAPHVPRLANPLGAGTGRSTFASAAKAGEVGGVRGLVWT